LREAQAAYRQAIALQADYAEAFQKLGRVLLRLHQPDDALAAFDSAISIRPNNIVFLIDRADALLQLGRMV
jgi:tetratricopeptide (TPR) repeat protein